MMFRSRKLLAKLLSSRRFHCSPVSLLDINKVEEIKIPVPWGHIAGKWWGSRDIQPILGLHGWQDNAGTWEPLVPFITEEHSLLAIDLPGSGISSHLPVFINYHFIDSALIVERIRLHLGLDKILLLGHSGGSATSFLYSALYPERVRGYCGIDYLAYAYKDEVKRSKTIGDVIDKNIKLALRDPEQAQSYTWEEAKKIWVSATMGSVSEASAEILMKRGVRRTPDNKVVFSRDNRLKTELLEKVNVSQIENVASNISCHVMLIKASKSPLFDKGIKNVPHILDIIKKNAKSFQFHTVPGGHHLHMDTPEVIWDLLHKFLKTC